MGSTAPRGSQRIGQSVGEREAGEHEAGQRGGEYEIPQHAKRVAFNTLGCRLNQYETDALVTSFRQAGYQVVDWQKPADAYIINTCTVTDRSDRKSRALINQAARAGMGTGEEASSGAFSGAAAVSASGVSAGSSTSNPVIVVTGCYAEKEGVRLSEASPITYLVDNDRKSQIFHIVDAHFRGEAGHPEELPADRFSFGDAAGGFHTRSTIKIQDGCDNFCTFCIIPHVRGRALSRPAPGVVDQAEQLIASGAREIVLTGVNIGRYESDGIQFVELTRRLLDLDGDFRLRISSIEPDSWGTDFIELLDHPKLCPHLHLCLQSGSERILLAMRRQYTVADYLSFVEQVRERKSDFNITTDVMVGFPGETEEEFEQTCSVVRTVGFSHIHTFPYSVREGTRAARMENQVPVKEKSRRAAVIRRLSDEYKRTYREGLIGGRQRLLVERIETTGARGAGAQGARDAGVNGAKGPATHGGLRVARGYGEHYVPIHLTDMPEDLRPNAFVEVRLDSLANGDDPVFHGVTDDSN